MVETETEGGRAFAAGTWGYFVGDRRVWLVLARGNRVSLAAIGLLVYFKTDWLMAHGFAHNHLAHNHVDTTVTWSCR